MISSLALQPRALLVNFAFLVKAHPRAIHRCVSANAAGSMGTDMVAQQIIDMNFMSHAGLALRPSSDGIELHKTPQ